MIFVPIASLAQVNVYLNGTVGTYAMGDLKSLMENIETQFYQRFDIPLNRTSNFPLSQAKQSLRLKMSIIPMGAISIMP
jgi:hypothetical protein